MASSAGQRDPVHAAHGKPPNHRLWAVLKQSYQDIQDLNDANPHNPKIITIDEKNDYHLDRGDDDEKSVISPTYCEYKLCKAMFSEFSRIAVRTIHDKNGREQARLLVTSTCNKKIGWSNFNPTHHQVGNEDSEHFITIYTQLKGHGDWFILSIQLAKIQFLLNHQNTDDYYVFNRNQGPITPIDSQNIKK